MQGILFSKSVGQSKRVNGLGFGLYSIDFKSSLRHWHWNTKNVKQDRLGVLFFKYYSEFK